MTEVDDSADSWWVDLRDELWPPSDLEYTIGSDATGRERCVIHPAGDDDHAAQWIAADWGSFVSLDELR